MQKIEMQKRSTLQACTRASKVSKDNQDIKMTDDATSTEDIHLPPHYEGTLSQARFR